MRWSEPGWLGLIFLAVLPWVWGWRRVGLAWPTLAGFPNGGSRRVASLRALPWVVRGSALACLALAMARPQSVGGQVRVAGRGVAIMALVDRSSSMKTVDFPSERNTISRLDAAKTTLSRFIQARGDDLVGLVSFANYSDAVAPTLDQGSLLEAVQAIRPAGPIDDGTNLGDALILGLGAIRDAPTRRKVMILLTDGRNAPAVPRPVDPVVAAALARELKVTLHTIAIGKPSGTIVKPSPNEADGPDLALLARMAEVGGGRSFVASDAGMLEEVFREIDALEKSPVVGTVRTLYREEYAAWAAAALALLGFDIAWASGRFRQLP